jgi:NAD(P)-dependent dehydrogenase (short-subunit alcohol dehydrogenase family)
MPTDTKIALITGGSRGLGRNTAIALARKGTDVIVTYRARQDEAQSAIAEIESHGRKALALHLDTAEIHTFPDFTARLREALATLWNTNTFHALVNNAGAGHHAPFAETTESAFDTLMNTHLKGPYFLTQALLPLLADGARIINISSGLARFTLPGASAYAMMKGGTEVFTRYLAKELGARGITANTVAPGAIATDFNGGRVRDNPDLNRMVSQTTALGRAGLPDDIGPMIAALLSDDNRWINGQRIEVSGGANL